MARNYKRPRKFSAIIVGRSWTGNDFPIKRVTIFSQSFVLIWLANCIDRKLAWAEIIALTDFYGQSNSWVIKYDEGHLAAAFADRVKTSAAEMFFGLAGLGESFRYL